MLPSGWSTIGENESQSPSGMRVRGLLNHCKSMEIKEAAGADFAAPNAGSSAKEEGKGDAAGSPAALAFTVYCM